MKITIIADDMPVIHIGSLTSAVEIKKHRSENVLDHPDRSVTKAKLHEEVLEMFTDHLHNGEKEGSLYVSDAIPDNLGLGAFAGGYKGQATANYSATGGYGCVVGARGYKILEINECTSPDDGDASLIVTFIEFTLQNITNLDTNAGSCPQLEKWADVYVLIKDPVVGWNVQPIGVVDSIDSETNKVIISGQGYIDVKSYTPDIVPLLLLSLSGIDNSPWKVLSTKYANACLGDMFCFGPDAIALTEEQITELTANGIKVGSGARGISTGHFGTVLGKYGISYNNRGRSIGESSKCGGQESWARGGGSDVHGLQCQTMPDARHSFARGGYNIVYGAFAASLGIGNHVHTLGGLGRGTYGEKDAAGKYLDFIGIGSDDSNRQNGYTFDKHGNVWFKGSIKIGGTSFDDEDASTVATLADLKDIPAPDMSGYATTADIDNIMAEIIEVQKAIVGGEL